MSVCTVSWCWGWLSKETIQVHLLDNGFMEGYYIWMCHGEVEEFARSYRSSSQGVLVKNSNYSNRWCMISQALVLRLMTNPFMKVFLKIQIIRSSENCSSM